MRRRDFIKGIAGTAAAWPLASRAAGVRTIGFLYPGPEPAAKPRIAALLAGLAQGGYREGSVQVIVRAAHGDASLLAPMAADLIARKVDLIAAIGPAAVRVAHSASSNIPVVAIDLESDPVASGWAASVARPGGDITGVFLNFPTFSQKWLELLKEAVPQVASVAVFWDPTTSTIQVKAAEQAAGVLKLKLETFEVRAPGDVNPAFQSAAQRGVGALLILSSPFIGANTKLLAEKASTQHLPAITLYTDFAHNGGLMAYGPNLLALYRQYGALAAKVLDGRQPADLPIENPTKFEFVVNLKTAKALGLTLPNSLLGLADDVIE
jgi:putative tryptophan/tyrosine transport system substrate-binding protein